MTARLGGKTATASTDGKGRWRVAMPAMPAGGQSNMAFPARLSTGAWPGFPGNPDLRFVNLQLASAAAVQPDLKQPVPGCGATMRYRLACSSPDAT